MRPKLKPFLAWTRMGERALLVQGGGLRLYFQGDSVPALASLLPRLDGAARPAEAEMELVRTLQARGVLDDLDADDEGEETPLVRALSVYTATPRAAARRLASTPVRVEGASPFARRVRGIVEESGGRVVDGEGAAFAVLAEEAPAAIDRAPRIPLVRASLDGGVAWVGPTWLPGHACPACLRERLRGQTSRPETLDAWARAVAERPPPGAALPTLAHQAAAVAAQEAVLFASGARPPALVDRAVEITATEGAVLHPVLPALQCPACGGPTPAPRP